MPCAKCCHPATPLSLPLLRARHLTLVPGTGQAVSASHDTTLKVWDVDTEASTAQLWGHSSLVYAAAATPAGLLASGSEDNTSRLWHAGGGPSLQVGWRGTFTAQGCAGGTCLDVSTG